MRETTRWLGMWLVGCTLALAQDLPERITFPGGEHATIGFELKTTTHAQRGSGTTTDHKLMALLEPNPQGSWSEAQKATVARWGQLSTAERTAFFFEHYGSDANWRPNAEKAPYLDKAVSWHGRIDSPREAF